MKKYLFPLIFSIFTSCATTISTTMDRPAELDLGGVSTISTVPFDISKEARYDKNISEWYDIKSFHGMLLRLMLDKKPTINREQRKITEFLNRKLVNELKNSRYFEFVEIKSDSYEKFPSDIVIIGSIDDFNVRIDSKEYRECIKDEKGREQYEFRKRYTKTIDLKIEYDIFMTKTGTIVYSGSKYCYRTSGECESMSAIPKNIDMLASDLSELVSAIMKKIQPYKISLNLTLMDDKDKKMKETAKLAENGLFDLAKDAYLEIYDSTSNYKAGYNAALLMFARKDFKSAKELMTKIVLESNDTSAIKSLKMIEAEIEYKNRFDSQKQMHESVLDAK